MLHLGPPFMTNMTDLGTGVDRKKYLLYSIYKLQLKACTSLLDVVRVMVSS